MKIIALIRGHLKRILEAYFVLKLERFGQIWRWLICWAILIIGIASFQVAQIHSLQSYYTRPSPAPGGVFNQGVLGQITNLNPIHGTTLADKIATKLLFSSLMTTDADGNLMPDLAIGYSIDKTNKRYTVTLKNNLIWHDGQALTADDIVFTIETIQNGLTQSRFKNNWQDVKVDRLDERTVVFDLKSEFSSFPFLLTTPIIPQHILKDISRDQLLNFSFNPVGSGPFKFSKFQTINDPRFNQPIQRLELIANQDYQNSSLDNRTPKLAGFILWATENQDQINRLFNQGQLTASFNLKLDKPKPNYRELDLKTTTAVYLFFKNQQPPINDRQLRRALMSGLDIDQIRSQIVSPNERLSGPILDKGSPKLPTHNPRKLRQGLQKLGWELNQNNQWVKNGEVLKLKLTTKKGTEYEAVAKLIQSEFEKNHIQIDLEFIKKGTFDNEVINNHYYSDLLLYGLNLGYDEDLYPFWHSSQINSHSVLRFNLAEYKSATADQILESIRGQMDPKRRQKLAADLVEIWSNDLPAVPLYRNKINYHISDKVRGLDQTIQINDQSDLFNQVQNWTMRIVSKIY